MNTVMELLKYASFVSALEKKAMLSSRTLTAGVYCLFCLFVSHL